MTAPAPAREAILPAGDRRRVLVPALGAAAVVAGVAYLAIADPSEGGVFLPCPFHAATGLWCPGCGTTRGLHALLRGDLGAAIGFNVLTVLALPFVLWGILAWWSNRSGRLRVPAPPSPGAAVSIALFVVVVAFGVLRNLPGTPFAVLAP